MIRTIIFISVMLFSRQAFADCDIADIPIQSVQAAHSEFLANPNSSNASKFFDFIPSDFCKFNKLFGYPNDLESPLYRLDLFLAMPLLANSISKKLLSSKYVQLASQARWDADGINALQGAYYELFRKSPKLLIGSIEKLDPVKRRTAIVFLFDGPHPSNSFFNAKFRKKICGISSTFCKEMKSVELVLAKQEEMH